jgi:hypothetical protein
MTEMLPDRETDCREEIGVDLLVRVSSKVRVTCLRGPRRNASIGAAVGTGTAQAARQRPPRRFFRAVTLRLSALLVLCTRRVASMDCVLHLLYSIEAMSLYWLTFW